MASNPYLQWYTSSNEQKLFDDLTVESIKNFACDVKYLPRTGTNFNDMLNEYEIYSFNDALDVEIFIKNADSFEGEGELMSKFGLEIRTQMTVNLSIRSFEQFIKPTTNKARPVEGDCIYIPFLDAVYEITYINQAAQFYTVGKLMSYQLTLELLEFNNEQFNTGIAAIDDKYKKFDNATDPNYDLNDYDNAADNDVISDNADDILDLSEISPFDLGD